MNRLFWGNNYALDFIFRYFCATLFKGANCANTYKSYFFQSKKKLLTAKHLGSGVCDTKSPNCVLNREAKRSVLGFELNSVHTKRKILSLNFHSVNLLSFLVPWNTCHRNVILLCLRPLPNLFFLSIEFNRITSTKLICTKYCYRIITEDLNMGEVNISG